MEKNRAWYCISHLTEVSVCKLNHLKEQKKDPEEMIGMTEKEWEETGLFTEKELAFTAEWRKKLPDFLEAYDRMKDKNIWYVSEEDPEYPALLQDLPDRPIGLFGIGKKPVKERVCAGIVGARACSAYGRDTAARFGTVLSDCGVHIVSGMACGIDSAAQNGALDAKGGSTAVLAGGPDWYYPKESMDLYEKLCEKGTILSEMPPQTPPRPWLFIRRNRIISGMSQAVIVVEARKKSGSLITAEFAAEQGRGVYAIPGRIDTGLSEGCHQLIRNGAILLSSPEEFLEDYHMVMEAECARTFHPLRRKLEGREGQVYEVLTSDPLHLEDLLERTGLPCGDLAEILLRLEIAGYILQEPKNYYRII